MRLYKRILGLVQRNYNFTLFKFSCYSRRTSLMWEHTQRSQRLFYSSESPWKYFSSKVARYRLRFCLDLIYSIETAPLQFQFHFGENRTKSQGARSGEYVGCGDIVRYLMKLKAHVKTVLTLSL